jgi:hypothetical protein
MRLKRWCWLQGTLPGLLAAVLATGCASSETRVREIDPQAEPILKRMCTTLDGAKAFSFRVESTMDERVETGQLAQFRRASDIVVVRPDRMYVQTDSDHGNWTAWYAGKSLTILDRKTNAYAAEAVPRRIDEMLDYMADEYDLVMPMADLLVGKTYDSLLEDVESGSYVGLHDVGGTPCHHLLCRQENIDWQIWIDAGEQALPRKMLITYTQEPDQPQYIATLSGWDLKPATSAETFTFTAPAGAKSVTMAELVDEDEGE